MSFMITVKSTRVVFVVSRTEQKEFTNEIKQDVGEFMEAHSDGVLEEGSIDVAFGDGVREIVEKLGEDIDVPICCDDCGYIDACVCDDNEPG